MNKKEQAKLTDGIVVDAEFIDNRNLKVGEAYEKIARRRGAEFREKVKELPSEAFSTSRMAHEYQPEPSELERALRMRKK